MIYRQHYCSSMQQPDLGYREVRSSCNCYALYSKAIGTLQALFTYLLSRMCVFPSFASLGLPDVREQIPWCTIYIFNNLSLWGPLLQLRRSLCRKCKLKIDYLNPVLHFLLLPLSRIDVWKTNDLGWERLLLYFFLNDNQ
jgi:hypothetical protein